MSFLPNRYILGPFVALFLCWIIRQYRRQQRYIPGVPIFGGKSKIKVNRQLFATQSLPILRKGYEEVSMQAIPTPGTISGKHLRNLPREAILLSGVDRTMVSYSMFPPLLGSD